MLVKWNLNAEPERLVVVSFHAAGRNEDVVPRNDKQLLDSNAELEK